MCVGGALPAQVRVSDPGPEAHRWVLPHHPPPLVTMRGRVVLTANQHGNLFLVLEYTPLILLSLAMYFQMYLKKYPILEKEDFCTFP